MIGPAAVDLRPCTQQTEADPPSTDSKPGGLVAELLLSLPDLVGIAVAMAITTAIGLLVYLVSYKLISKYQSNDLKDPTSSLFRLVGVLISLMLSLAFADVILQMRAIQNAMGREAVAIADTYNDLKSFDPEVTRETRALLIRYTQSVIDHDWPALADDRLSDQTRVLKRELADRVMKLEPATPKQEMLWSLIVADMDAISDHRLTRLDNALAEPPIFTYVVMFGFLVTMACFGAYRPQGPLVAMASLYTAFIGFVLYLVLALSDPYQGGFSVHTTTFERLVERLQIDIA